ncbi:hypothetical protein TNCV_3223091 [Trichonephila clavipes]|nr:hypothetical protein TNCV_3223091 [Trichonephila clavipes]
MICIDIVVSFPKERKGSCQNLRQRENTLEGPRPLTSLPLTPTSRKDLRFDGYLEYPSCRKGTIQLQTSMFSLEFETRPYGTVGSVITTVPDVRRWLKRPPVGVVRKLGESDASSDVTLLP